MGKSIKDTTGHTTEQRFGDLAFEIWNDTIENLQVDLQISQLVTGVDVVCRPLNMKGIRMQLKKKENVIGMLDKAIAYGEDLKSRIESDSENDLETLKSEYETWCSDNETSLAEIIPNHKSHYPLAPFHVENHSRAEILGDSDDESAWISRYNRQRQRLILGVENEIKGLSSIRKKIKDGTLDF